MSLVNPKDRIFKKPYKPPYMTSLARAMRKEPTPAERLLWEALREKGFFGYRLRRQAPFGRYIFDIYCAKKKVAFEIDGDSHLGKAAYDGRREREVAASLVKIVRFRNEEVLQNIEGVVEKIRAVLDGR